MELPILSGMKANVIAATTAGVAGPDVPCKMFWLTNPSGGTDTVTMCGSNRVGGIEILPGGTYGPFPGPNLNIHIFKSASGNYNLSYYTRDSK